MQISTEITVDDHREFIHRVFNEGREGRNAGWLRWELWLAAIFVIVPVLFFFRSLASGLWHGGLVAVLMAEPVLLFYVLLGLVLTVVVVFYLRWIGRMRRDLKAVSKDEAIDEAGLREGINLGPARFDADEAGIQVAVAESQSRYAWRAFREFMETKRNFYLMIDRGSMLIVPKRGVDDALLSEFRTLVSCHVAEPIQVPTP